MRHLASCFVACALVTACGGPQHSTAAASAPKASNAANLSIAQYLGSDDATGDRVHELLRAANIESSAGGSLGYSVWVNESDRAAARKILIAAASSECLRVTIVDDSGATVQRPRPSSCPQ